MGPPWGSLLITSLHHLVFLFGSCIYIFLCVNVICFDRVSPSTLCLSPLVCIFFTVFLSHHGQWLLLNLYKQKPSNPSYDKNAYKYRPIYLGWSHMLNKHEVLDSIPQLTPQWPFSKQNLEKYVTLWFHIAINQSHYHFERYKPVVPPIFP